MKNVLPVEYPIVTGYPVIANALSILQTQEKTMNWILLNLMVPIVWYDAESDKVLIDLGGDHTPWNTRYLYDDCPYLTVYRYDRTWFHEQNQDIIAFIKWNIDSDKYIYTDVCKKFISEYRSNNPERMHDLFIYGYDDEAQILFGSDFFHGEKYQNINVSFDDYRKAFEAVEEQQLPHRVEQTTDIMAITNRELFNTWLAVDYEDSQSVLVILKERILECLGKTNASYMRLGDEKVAYGINSYDLLQKYFQDKNFYESKCSYYNRMFVQFLVEYKGILLKVCRDLLKSDELAVQAEELINLANIIKGFVLKSTIRRICSSAEREKLIAYLKKSKKQETDLLQNMLTHIDSLILH
ncbi:hypothetical protein [Fumia xinanensis]|uniref:Uncharacterized protein n=1 Tax=Fumia xinanensis TaxID=2763659 RepID=A0A926I884_9FIRM|nr:hypothetical protein [Fumia xinanensis]MBC8560714.1 hypothetical protein [Fumia xinanensis]